METEGCLLVFSFFFSSLSWLSFRWEKNQSASQQTPLRCILDNWKLFDLLTLRRKCLKCFCATAWPQYPLGDRKNWPEDGSLNYNTILQLELLCKRQGKWTEIPYVQIFFWLRDMKELCFKYGIVVCPNSEPTRQTVLGTDSQEKEPLLPPRAPVKAHLPQLPSCLGLLPYIQMCPISGSIPSTNANTSMSLSWNCRRIQTNMGP